MNITAILLLVMALISIVLVGVLLSIRSLLKNELQKVKSELELLSGQVDGIHHKLWDCKIRLEENCEIYKEIANEKRS